jgi:hypothetical protein
MPKGWVYVEPGGSTVVKVPSGARRKQLLGLEIKIIRLQVIGRSFLDVFAFF